MSPQRDEASSWAQSDGTYALEQLARPEASAQLLLAKSDGTFALMLKHWKRLLASCSSSFAKSDGTYAQRLTMVVMLVSR